MTNTDVVIPWMESVARRLEDRPPDPSTTAPRMAALERARRAGLPTRRLEDWRLTPVSALRLGERTLRERTGSIGALGTEAIDGLDAVSLDLVDGELGSVPTDLPTGVEIRPILGLDAERGEAALASARLEDATAMECLNAAGHDRGVWLEVHAGADVVPCLHLRLESRPGTEPEIVLPRLHVRVGQGARVRLLLDHRAEGSSHLLWNLCVGLEVGPNAQVEILELVRTESTHALVASYRARVERDARFCLRTLSLDAGFVREDLRVRLVGENAACTVEGLTVADAHQVVDHHVWIHHDVPRTRSVETFRSVLDGHARGVFAGRVRVAEGARGTDAQQNNANLVLSAQAQMDTLPQLEIYNDDIKASHGATLGQLDLDALFYLRSRGIDEKSARAMLTFAFANELVEHLEPEALRAVVRRHILAHLPQDAAVIAVPALPSLEEST